MDDDNNVRAPDLESTSSNLTDTDNDDDMVLGIEYKDHRRQEGLKDDKQNPPRISNKNCVSRVYAIFEMMMQLRRVRREQVAKGTCCGRRLVAVLGNHVVVGDETNIRIPRKRMLRIVSREV